MSNTNSLFGGSTMMGVCYSPYHQKATKTFDSYTKADIDADLAITAGHFGFIRTYTVEYNQKYLPELCHKNGLTLALGCWITQGNSSATETEIDTAFEQALAYPDTVKAIVVGNEVDLVTDTQDYTYAEVEAALNYAIAKKADPKYAALSNVPVTVCMTGAGPAMSKWAPLLNIMERYAFLTIYPWYGQTSSNVNPADISGNMEWSYTNNIVPAEATGLEVVIAEIGWPSAGDDSKDTSWASEVTNYSATCSWINGNNAQSKAYITMWFEMFDEPWKTKEGPWGPHWGIYTSGETPTMKTDENKTPFTPCS